MFDEACVKIRDDIHRNNYSEEERVRVHVNSVWALWARKQQEIRVERLRQFELLQEHSRYGSVPVVFPCDDDPLTSRDAIINIFSSDTIINVAEEAEDEDEMVDEQDDHPIASSDSISDISESEDETDDDEEEYEMHPLASSETIINLAKSEDETNDEEDEAVMDDGLYYDV
jgi:macrodomain Ter protein organizer (MatP/YcbG family)